MELTKHETEIAERYISKRERQLAQWPRRRWLIVAIFTAFTLLGYRMMNDGMRTIHDEKTTDSFVDRTIGEAPPPGQEQRWSVGRMLKIAKLLELRQQEVAYSLMEVAVGYLGILAGVSMVGIIVLRWNTDKRDALICKLLRGKLQELDQDAAATSRPPSQFPSLPEVQSSDSQRTSSSGSFG